MQTISYSNMRQNLSSIINEVVDNNEPICIKRTNGKNAVLIDEKDYYALIETAYLLKNPRNAKELYKGLEEANQGLGEKIEL